MKERTKYAVTGATGYIGGEICSMLARRGETVRALVRSRGRAYLPPEAEQVTGDVMEPESLEGLFRGWEGANTVCIHTAGVISVKHRDKRCEQVNTQGTRDVLEACRRHGVGKLVHFSSVDALWTGDGQKALEQPERFDPQRLLTSYGRSKAAAAQMVLDAPGKMERAVLLPSAVIGPGDYRGGLITEMLSLYLRGIPPVSIEGGYDFVDVRDVARAALNACAPGKVGCYLISGRYISVTQVFDILAEYTGRPKTKLTLPLWLLYPVVPLATMGYSIRNKQPSITLDALRLMKLHPEYSNAKARRELDFAPRPSKESIRDAAAFLMSRSGEAAQRQTGRG